MSSFIFLTFITLLQVSYADKRTVPVLMLDYELVMKHVQIEPNPFAKLTTAGFADIVHDSAKCSAGVIIFVEDNFSSEDISTKDIFGTPYKQIHGNLLENKDRVKYFASVVEPYKLLSQIFKLQKENVFYVSGNTKLQLQGNFKYYYIFFKDHLQDTVNKTRTEILRRHDSIISEIMSAARRLKFGPVVAYYTGKMNPVVVNKIEFIKDKTTESLRKSGVFIATPQALFRLYGVQAVTQTRRAVFDQPPVVLEEVMSRNTLFTRISYITFDLQFGFSFPENNTWKLDFVAIYEGDEEVGRTLMGVGAPSGYSYYCTEPISIVNNRDMSTVTISEYHIEPKNVTSEEQFSPSVHCTPFFTSALLSCLMVSFMCMSILMYGVTSLMDCSSNDRYEDPNSKPLIHEVMH